MTPNPYDPPTALAASPALAGAAAASPVGTFALVCFAVGVLVQWAERGLDVVIRRSPDTSRVLTVTYVRLESAGTVACVVGGIAFLAWVYRAAQRAHDQGRKGLTISPGMCVAWFFVPGAMLFMPYRAMSGIATAADPRERGYSPGYVFAWWAMYVGSLLTVTLDARLASRHPDPGDDLVVSTLATALATGALAALWATMRFIQRGQAYWAAHDAAEAAPAPRKRRRRKAVKKATTEDGGAP
jgi:hypothetical protein